MRLRDALLLLALSLLWGSSYLFIRIAVPAFGPAGLVLARLLLGGTVLYVIAKAVRRPLVLRPYAGRLVILGLLNAALPYLLISAAELHLTASFAAVLTATVPLFAAMFGAVWLSERLTTARVAGLFAGVAGVAVMVGLSPGQLTFTTTLSVVAMLASAASFAGAGIYARVKLHGVPVHTLALGQQLGALVWLAVPGVILAPRHLPPPAAIWSVLALSMICTGVAYLLYFRLLERIGPTRTSTVTYLIPGVGLLWGAVALGEPVSGGMVAGLLMVLASVALVSEVQVGSLFGRLVPRRSMP